jgi:ATP-dependent helicase/nuclease subunit A
MAISEQYPLLTARWTMADFKWSVAQEQAISACGGAVLVSAAAGSGKTAVLVERVLRRLEGARCNARACDPAELLIVTFTRAAAAQLRQKLSTKLAERARLNPENMELRRKLLLLPSAQISTIDSLCGRIVRENFSACGLPPDFRLLDDAQSRALEAETMDALLHGAYEASEPDFTALTALFSDAHGDNKLEGAILSIWGQARANPNPEEWLGALLAPYQALHATPLREGIWAQLLLREADEALDSLLLLHKEALPLFAQEAAVNAAFTAAYLSDAALLEHLRNKLADGSWDDICAAFAAVKYEARGKKAKAYEESPMWTWAGKRRDKMKESLKKLRSGLFFLDEETICADTSRLLPLARELIRLALRFDEDFTARKRERGWADFGDVQHLALRLLINPDGSETELAAALSVQFAEILVDEYQDVNRVQEALFRALSRDGANLFFVGDVKQSIYRFRQAEPAIFLERRESLAPYTDGAPGGKVILGRNYRSLPGVTACVNYIFAALMQTRAGEVDYTQDEYLIPHRTALSGVAYNAPPDVVFRLLRTEKGDRSEQQARYCAKLVEDLIASERQIEDGGTVRPVQPGDIAILMRSPKKSAALYAAALGRRGILCRTELSGGFFEANEIRLALSLLQIIDNPVQDVPLLAVLLSPLFGFSEDEAAALAPATGESLYRRIVAADGEQDSGFPELPLRCSDFLRALGEWRSLSLALPCGLFLRRLFEESGLGAVVCAMKNGTRRQANLRKLEELAAQSNSAERPGLSGLLRFLEAIRERGGDMDSAPLAESGGAVRIMSIHKAKGLEFPVCIVADIGKSFNAEDGKKAAVLSPKAGLGLKLREGDAFGVYPTLPHTAAKLERRALDRAEELRLLYVAATRAKDLLVFVGAPASSSTTPEAVLAAAAAALPIGERFPAWAVRGANSYLDWLLPVFLRHPDANTLRSAAGFAELNAQSAAFTLDAQADEIPPEEAARETAAELPAANIELTAEIRARMDWRYPASAPEGMPAKQTASSFAKSDYPDKVAQARPTFLEPDTRGAAQRGTLLHWVLERLDFAAALPDLPSALAEITPEGGLDAQSLTASEKNMLRRFFESDIVRRYLASPRKQRERQFTARIPLGELYPEHAECTEKITVIGAADCVFEENGELVIVDYKTDRAAPDELLHRYAPQLRVYAKALALCEEMPVREAVLYSLRAGSLIDIPLDK